MLASSSTASATLLRASKTSDQGLKHLYRTILQQARLLSITFDDPILFSSHRHLARKNLEPLLSSSIPSSSTDREWPLPTTVKRMLRAKAHRRHLADANFGWEHSVYRSLSLAYARSGKLRRDVLSDLSPVASSSAEEHKYERKLRRKDFSPVLQTLLTNASSMDGAAVKSREHLMRRPPPPFLPAEDDALVKHFGKALGRRRVANASNRFVKTYLKKVLVPLDVVSSGLVEQESVFAHLEARARPPSSGKPAKGDDARDHKWLSGTLENMSLYRSKINSSEHRKRALRQHGWSSHPKDYSRARRRRRLYGRLLSDAPLLLVEPCTPDVAGCVGQQRKNDPLGIRAKLGGISQQGGVKMKVVKSRYAVGPKARSGGGGGGGELDPHGLFDTGAKQRTAEEGLDDSEVSFLRQQGIL